MLNRRDLIVLSAAQVNSASIRRAYELGASSYFVKGNVPMAHIYSDLAARLIERGTGRPGTYNFGSVEFDPTRRTVRTGAGEVRLTPQQTALVLHLAQASARMQAAFGNVLESNAGKPAETETAPTTAEGVPLQRFGG